jgi:hypothetical protein
MYKFNPQHIADLAGGKVILGHTKKEEDLPLLRAVVKETFPNGYWEILGNNDHYFKSNIYADDFYCSDVISIDLQHLPIIHLHDFLLKDELPKEELSRIDLMDKRLKELEGIVKDNGNQEFIQWLTSINVANKIVKMFEGEMKQAPKIAEPKINYSVQVAYIYEGYYGIEIGDLNGVMNKDQADQTADLIRWVLDNQETVLKLKNQ